MALMTGVSACAALLYGAPQAAGRYLAVSVAAGLAGWAASRLDAPDDLRRNEALAVIALSFVVAASTLVWPFASEGLPWSDAIFEAVSAVTTTGLSTMGGSAELPDHILFVRSWAQWYGGLTILVLALGTMLSPGRAARRLAAPNLDSEDLLAGTRGRARGILTLYLGLTASVFIALTVSGASAENALVHALSSVSTGGFSNLDGGIRNLGSPAALLVLSGAALLGALSFPLQVQAWKRRPGALGRDSELWALLGLSALAAAALTATMRVGSGLEWSEVAVHAPFLAVSAQTTTGFATLDVGSLDAASKCVLIISMAIGGDMGSTAGGFKLFRLLILLDMVGRLFARTALPPHALTKTTVSGERIPDEESLTAASVVFLYVATILVSWLAFLAYALDPLDSLFDVVSALGTVGLSTGIVAAELPSALKAVLCADMIMGRVEIVAFLVLFYHRTWTPRRAGA